MGLSLGDILLHFRARTTEVDAAFPRIERQGATFAQRMAPFLQQRVSADAGNLYNLLGQAEGAVQSWGGRVRGFLAQSLTIPAGNFLGGLVSQIKGMVTGSVIGMNASLEKSTLQFKTLMGDADKAREHVKMLFEFAKQTPFETEPIIRASRTLQTFGGTALNNVDNLTQVGDASAAVSEDISRVAFWWGQLYTNIQGGTPFGQATITLQEMGILAPEVRNKLEEMQKSGASAAAIWDYFTESMKRYKGAMIDQARTWEGLISTISDGLKMFGAQAGKPIFDLGKRALSGFADMLANPMVPAAAAAIAAGLQKIIDAADGLVARAMPAVRSLGAGIQLLVTGDFQGGIFGLTEDSPVITALLRMHDRLALVGGAVRYLATGQMSEAFLQALGPSNVLVARLQQLRYQITTFGANAQQVFTQLGAALRVVATGDFQGGIFGLTEDSPAIAALLRANAALRTLGTAWTALVFGFQTGGITGALLELVTSLGGLEARFGPVGQAIERMGLWLGRARDQVRLFANDLDAGPRVALARLAARLAGGLPGMVEAGRAAARDLVTGLVTMIPVGLREGLARVAGPLSGAVAGVFGGLTLGPAVAGLLLPLGAALAPLSALLGPVGLAVGKLGGMFGFLTPSLAGLGGAFRTLMNPLGLLRGAFTNLGMAGLMLLNPLTALKSVGPLLAGGLAGIGPMLRSGLGSIGPMLLGLKTPIGMVLNLGRTVLSLVTPFGIIVALVAAFAGAFATNFGGIRQVTDTALSPLMGILQAFGPILQTVLSMFATGDWAGGIAVLKTQIGNLGPLFTQAAGTLQTGLPAIFAILMQYIGGVATQVIGWIGAALPPILTKLGEWTLAFLAWVAPMIAPMLAALGGMIGQVLVALGAALPGIVGALAGFAGAFVSWVLVAGPPLLVQLGGLITQLLGWVALQLPPLAAQLGAWALQFLSWVGPMIPLLLLALGGLLAGFLGWIMEKGPAILEKLGLWTQQFLTWVTTAALPALLGAFGTMFSGLWTELQKLWNTAFAEGSLGASMMEGLKAGILAAWAGFAGWFQVRLLAILPDWAKPLLGAHAGAPAGADSKAAPPTGTRPAPPTGTRPAPPTGTRDGLDGQRADGGPVRRGLRYLIGERGPEIFEPGADGQISPNDVYQAMTDPMANVGAISRAVTGPTPRLPAASAAPRAGAGGIGAGVNVSITIQNPVVDSAERLEQLKQQTLAEATRQFTTAINRLVLSEG